jgi:hypothetical protein
MLAQSRLLDEGDEKPSFDIFSMIGNDNTLMSIRMTHNIVTSCRMVNIIASFFQDSYDFLRL